MSNHTIVTGSGHMSLEGASAQIFGTASRAPVIPGFTLPALLEFGPYVDDGRLVEAVAIPWYAILDVFEQNPEEIYQIGADSWEHIIAGAYKTAGYDVVLTRTSRYRSRLRLPPFRVHPDVPAVTSPVPAPGLQERRKSGPRNCLQRWIQLRPVDARERGSITGRVGSFDAEAGWGL